MGKLGVFSFFNNIFNLHTLPQILLRILILPVWGLLLFFLAFLSLIPGVFFFHLFKISIFKGVVTSFSPKTRLKTLGRAGDFKKGPIWLRFCTLDPWVNPWGYFFHCFKISFFWAWSPGLASNEAKDFGSRWRFQKWSDLAEIFTLVP